MTGAHLHGTPRILGRLAAQFGAFALIALIAGACVSAMVAVTPAQRAYSAISEYQIVLDAAVTYAESPIAKPEVVRQLDTYNRQAQTIITRIRNVITMAGLLNEPNEAELTDLTRILKFFQAAASRELIEASP